MGCTRGAAAQERSLQPIAKGFAQASRAARLNFAREARHPRKQESIMSIRKGGTEVGGVEFIPRELQESQEHRVTPPSQPSGGEGSSSERSAGQSYEERVPDQSGAVSDRPDPKERKAS